MNFTKEEACNKIAELVERFDEQFASYKQSSYNETLTRKDFIDPFFKAQGWDMNNSNGYTEAYPIQIENKIGYCENRINQIVYSLYELTEEQIKIVEGV